MENIQYAASLSVVLGFIGAVFSYIVLRPLNAAIDNLNDAVVELRREIVSAEYRWHDLEVKVAEIDQRARSAHHRIDEIVKYCQRNGVNIFMHERMSDNNEGVEHR